MRFVATSPSKPKVPHLETGGQTRCCVSYVDNVIEAFSQEPFDLLYLVSVSSMLLKFILSLSCVEFFCDSFKVASGACRPHDSLHLEL